MSITDELGWDLELGTFFPQVWLEKRYISSRHNSEWFNTAGRNIKTGLIASVIVSQVITLRSNFCTSIRPRLFYAVRSSLRF